MNKKNLDDLDIKDRKILYELELDARQSFSQIGKKVGLPKTVITYRINNLLKTRVIKDFKTMIDISKLGYLFLRFYIKYQYVTPKIKKEIIDYFLKSKYVVILHSVEGSYDLVVFMAVNDIPEFYTFWKQTLDKYRDYFSNQIFSLYFQEHLYDCAFLINQKSDRKKLILLHDTSTKIDIDALDRQILTILSTKARSSLIQIAKITKSTPEVIHYRIKKLKTLQVIQGYKINIDFSKLGYQLFKIDIVLKERDKLRPIIRYAESNPNFFCVDNTIGYVDLELEFILKNTNELNEIMGDIETKFPNSIRHYTYICFLTTHKFCYLPEK
ncbi:MAG: Lrp/AsnC family transcriptional regulator [Euryarchaeota archaeon]|nr:Lrp/AsnC family transcriptional regulator [Euryarchaeota archaeon]